MAAGAMPLTWRPLRAAWSASCAGQRREDGDALPQRRDVEGDDVDPVEQVGAEPAGGHLALQRAVAGHDQPGLEPQGLVRADRLEGPLLDDAQQFGLELRGERIDLVEEQGAAADRGEFARALGVGPGEGAAHMTEHLALDQVGRQRPAVDRQERLVASRGEAVDHPGHVGLARPRLAADHDGRVQGGDPPDLLDHPAHPARGQEEERRVVPQRSNLAQVRLDVPRPGRQPVAGLDRQDVDQVGQPAQVQRPAHAFGHPQPREDQRLLGMGVLADDDRHQRPPVRRVHLEDSRQSRDIRLPIEVDQGDNDLIVF